jgi:hypothetical protein
MKTIQTIQDIQAQMEADLVKSKLEWEAKLAAVQAAEQTYVRIAELEQTIAAAQAEVKALRATLPNFGGDKSRSVATLPEGEPNHGVGAMAKDLLKQGYSAKDVHEMVCAHYGNQRTKRGNIYWYARELRLAGEL